MVILRALNSFGSLLIRALLFWFGLCVSFRSIRLMHCFVFVGAVVVCDFTQPYMSVCKPKCRACVCMCVCVWRCCCCASLLLLFCTFIYLFIFPVSRIRTVYWPKCPCISTRVLMGACLYILPTYLSFRYAYQPHRT